MSKYERQIRDPSPAQKPSSSPPSVIADAPSPARVTLPNDLSGSLKYLDEAQLRTLLEAVTVEIDRRDQATSNHKTALPAAPVVSAPDHLVTSRNKRSGVQEIPEGKANLIRASFKAGFRPAAIARTFRVSQSLVNRILSSIEKPKR
jgi:hypothetical protein